MTDESVRHTDPSAVSDLCAPYTYATEHRGARPIENAMYAALAVFGVLQVNLVFPATPCSVATRVSPSHLHACKKKQFESSGEKKVEEFGAPRLSP